MDCPAGFKPATPGSSPSVEFNGVAAALESSQRGAATSRSGLEDPILQPCRLSVIPTAFLTALTGISTIPPEGISVARAREVVYRERAAEGEES